MTDPDDSCTIVHVEFDFEKFRIPNFPTPRTFEEGQTICTDRGMKAASVDSQEKLELILESFGGSIKSSWVGVKALFLDQQGTEAFGNINGTTSNDFLHVGVGEFPWAENQPTLLTGGTELNCIVLNAAGLLEVEDCNAGNTDIICDAGCDLSSQLETPNEPELPDSTRLVGYELTFGVLVLALLALIVLLVNRIKEWKRTRLNIADPPDTFFGPIIKDWDDITL